MGQNMPVNIYLYSKSYFTEERLHETSFFKLSRRL